MKSIFHTRTSTTGLDLSLLIARVTVASFMFTHGYKKMMKLFGDEPVTFGDPLHIGVMASLLLTVFAEVICQLFIFFGLGTRLAAVPGIITMAVAAFIVNAGNFGKMELALLYMLIYVILLICGSGRYSVDHYISSTSGRS